MLGSCNCQKVSRFRLKATAITQSSFFIRADHSESHKKEGDRFLYTNLHDEQRLNNSERVLF